MMTWISRLNEAMQYIEMHLSEKIELEALARIACCSEYHFQRMFSYMADVPLSEYIRRRRMSLAAADLKSGEEKIVDIALKYGYDSPTAFNRAFQSIHGAPPSVVRKENLSVKSYPPIQFHLSISGGQALEYRIEKMKEFRVVGYGAQLSDKIEENFENVPQLWSRLAQEGSIPKLIAMMNRPPFGLLGVSACNDRNVWRYYIGVSTDQPLLEGMEELIVPESTWAVFSGSGQGTDIQQLEKRVVLEWLPTSGYEYANAPDVEVYLNDDSQNARFEVWIPVVKK